MIKSGFTRFSKEIGKIRKAEETTGNGNDQIWVLQVVGSNPAAPTKNTVDSLTFFPRDSDVILTRGSYAVPSSPAGRESWARMTAHHLVDGALAASE
jgi:hypothetical protein